MNQINEPVFHARPYASVGIGGGGLWHNRAVSPWVANPSGPRAKPDVYIEPVLAAFIPLNEWAGFYLLPTYWNFLLTGNQYADPDRQLLRIRKLHLALNGGLVGAAYSSRDGWNFEFGTALQAKYLLTDRVFTEVGYNALTDHEGSAFVNAWSAGLGFQWLPDLSLYANYSGAHFALPENNYVSGNGQDYLNGDMNSEIELTVPWYIRGKHIVTPEAGYGFRNGGGSDGYYLKTGLHYRFVFD